LITFQLGVIQAFVFGLEGNFCGTIFFGKSQILQEVLHPAPATRETKKQEDHT